MWNFVIVLLLVYVLSAVFVRLVMGLPERDESFNIRLLLWLISPLMTGIVLLTGFTWVTLWVLSCGIFPSPFGRGK